MTFRRRPLRPLARILSAERFGTTPETIEEQERKRRWDNTYEELRIRETSRLIFVMVALFVSFITVGTRMIWIATTPAQEPRFASVHGSAIVDTRADIVDRNGRILATNLASKALYAQPHIMVDPEAAAQGLARIFPDLDAATWQARFTSGQRFIWVRRNLSPEQMQQVHDLGEPGLLFGPRDMRLYPNGPIAAHVLGGAGYGEEGVNSAEIVGRRGVEAYFDDVLRDPAQESEPLFLSLDLSVQAATERVLEDGMKLMNAQAATAVLMHIHTGEVIALASLPDYDPNDHPRVAQAIDPLFNRAVQGVYELGSTFKPFTIAQAIELGLYTPESRIDVRGPLRDGGPPIRDFHDMGQELSVHDILVRSSNVGTARIAMEIGGDRQRAFLEALGLAQPTALEMMEARSVRPLMPDPWRLINTMTISYGHGFSTSPLHLAAAYATLVNGGTRVTPTLLQRSEPQSGVRVISQSVSEQMQDMLVDAVNAPQGTASFARMDAYTKAYTVGGKTGTADKPNPEGGYYDDKVLTTFASFFPAEAPQYVLVVTLDEPEDRSGLEPRRTAGWTAVPVAAEIIRRVAPLLGIRPAIASSPHLAIAFSAN